VTDITAQKLASTGPAGQSAGAFSARVSWALVLAICVVMFSFFWMNEWPTANAAYSVAVTGAIIAFFAALSGRILFATVLAAAQVGIVCVAAIVKLKTMDMLVHAYDLYFYLRSWSTVEFLATSYPLYAFGLLGALVGSLVLAILVYRLDGARTARWKAALVFLALGAGSVAINEAQGERRHMHLYYGGRYLSTYYGSVPETVRTVWRGQMLEAAPQASGPLFSPLGACVTPSKKPHIILIHQESVVPPSHFPGLEYDRSADPFFQSHDGKLHKMRVETYGGASWLTEFSVLAGVSTHSFGSMRQFVQAFMEGKVR
jgi:hypothetical protein